MSVVLVLIHFYEFNLILTYRQQQKKNTTIYIFHSPETCLWPKVNLKQQQNKAVKCLSIDPLSGFIQKDEVDEC